MSMEMSHDFTQQWDLNVLRIFDNQVTLATFALKMDGSIGENGKRDLAAVANEKDSVFFRALVRHKAPRSRSRHAIGETKSGTYCIFGGVESATIGCITRCLHNGTE